MAWQRAGALRAGGGRKGAVGGPSGASGLRVRRLSSESPCRSLSKARGWDEMPADVPSAITSWKNFYFVSAGAVVTLHLIMRLLLCLCKWHGVRQQPQV